jgi:hypothetical protein
LRPQQEGFYPGSETLSKRALLKATMLQGGHPGARGHFGAKSPDNQGGRGGGRLGPVAEAQLPLEEEETDPFAQPTDSARQMFPESVYRDA